MSTQRIAFKVSGTVQGVGFRDFTQRRASEFGLKGFVEGEAQGTPESIQKLLKEINNGPRLAHVVKVEKKDLAVQDSETHFGVRRTSESAFDDTN
ncbi:acylphosphatase [Aspergillus oryzae]|uniref:Acylphosphatase n=1 Tax=Aspergillus oryzae TaxID=5062 RepID=A0A1S9DNE5_ASPOZ|nr:uncharacterized protein G4B84_003062 [Aspergillus flavus NRRL3357]OOO10581.1 acylphosphatase [Aspergillus oryzae]QMW27773.1 hypothetical protein G4B84_003062 [Aspergillus flavus NRRL3357]QMW39844.1 hypothetical protein G4B11_003124 [Aspergillus flavus]